MKRVVTAGEIGMPVALRGPGRVVSVAVRLELFLLAERCLTDFASSTGFRGRPRDVLTCAVGIIQFEDMRI